MLKRSEKLLENNMERLTERELDIFGDARYCKCHSNDCDYECDECDIVSEGANRLKAYEDAEEQLLKAAGVDLQSMIGEFMHYYNLQKEGRLVELPCKVGDDIYEFENIDIESCLKNGFCYSDIYVQWTVKSFEIDYLGDIWIHTYRKDPFDYSARVLKADEIGKTVFLIRKEAEAALERME
jgi:hypothetical protein